MKERAPLELLHELRKDLRQMAHWLQRSLDMCETMQLEGDLSDEQYDALEALTSRYARASDIVYQRMLRCLDRIELESPGTLLDAIHRAEKRGFFRDERKIDNRSMLRVPGSGMLSTGMEQAAGRPFMLSEWIHVAPSEWGVEGPAIVGAYGMGLQGWDVSYMFQNRDDGTFLSQIGRDRWEVTAPQVLGVFPAVARQVLRGDVAASETRATRYVHVPSLFEGKLDFDDSVGSLEYDVRAFDSDKVPSRALAVARCEVEFTDAPRPTPQFDLAPHVDGDEYVSTTGQLRWREGQARHDGHFTIDTPGTKAVVGFAEGRRARLGDVTITPRSRFSAIYLTAREPDATVAAGRHLLVVAMARARNSGMKVVADHLILDGGDAPVVLEPVQADIELTRPGNFTVHVLDHNGRKTGRTLPVEGGRFHIDGARDHTPYYLISF